MKSGNLKFLEPSEPLQACNGTALPFTAYKHNNNQKKGPYKKKKKTPKVILLRLCVRSKSYGAVATPQIQFGL